MPLPKQSEYNNSNKTYNEYMAGLSPWARQLTPTTLAAVEKLKDEGNYAFRRGKHAAAIEASHCHQACTACAASFMVLAVYVRSSGTPRRCCWRPTCPYYG